MEIRISLQKYNTNNNTHYPLSATTLLSNRGTRIVDNNNHSFQIDSEEEKFLEERYAEEMAKKLPQGTDKTPGLLQDIVAGLPDR